MIAEDLVGLLYINRRMNRATYDDGTNAEVAADHGEWMMYELIILLICSSS